MSNSGIGWYLATRCTSARVATALLQGVKPPTQAGYVHYPKLSAPVTMEAARALISTNDRLAVMIASSPLVEPDVLDFLARESSLAVRSALCSRSDLPAGTAAYLYGWAQKQMRDLDRHTLMECSHPGKWLDAALSVPNPNSDYQFNEIIEQVSNYARGVPVECLQMFARECVLLAGNFPKGWDAHWFLAGIVTALAQTGVGDDLGVAARVNNFLCGIDQTFSVARVVACAVSGSLPRDFVFAEEIVRAFFDQCTDSLVSQLGKFSFVIPADLAGSLSASRNAVLTPLLAAACVHSDLWSDEVVNRVAVSAGAGFVSSEGFFHVVHRLSDDTFNALLGDEEFWFSVAFAQAAPSSFYARVSALPAVTAVLFLLRLHPAFLARLIASSSGVPFTAGEFMRLVDVPGSGGRVSLTAADAPAVVVNSSFRYYLRSVPSVRGLSEPALSVVDALVAGVHEIIGDGRVPLWLLELLDVAGSHTLDVAVNSHDLSGSGGVFARAVLHWFSEVGGDDPFAWPAALALAPRWSGTVSELMLAARESLSS
jgi:hypothetical protein